MLTKILALIQAWDDTEKNVALFAPDETLLSIETEGLQEMVFGRFRLAPDDDPFEVPRGSLESIRVALIIVEGTNGANLTINGAGAARELRPTTEAVDAAVNTPRSFYLETCSDVDADPPFVIAHPDPTSEASISGIYVLVGDPTE